MHACMLYDQAAGAIHGAVMATTLTWHCQLCDSRYALLSELVGHIRAAHSSDCNLNFVCQVKGCPRMVWE